MPLYTGDIELNKQGYIQNRQKYLDRNQDFGE